MTTLSDAQFDDRGEHITTVVLRVAALLWFCYGLTQLASVWFISTRTNAMMRGITENMDTIFREMGGPRAGASGRGVPDLSSMSDVVWVSPVAQLAVALGLFVASTLLGQLIWTVGVPRRRVAPMSAFNQSSTSEGLLS